MYTNLVDKLALYSLVYIIINFSFLTCFLCYKYIDREIPRVYTNDIKKVNRFYVTDGISGLPRGNIKLVSRPSGQFCY